jgi:hypothetical protein
MSLMRFMFAACHAGVSLWVACADETVHFADATWHLLNCSGMQSSYGRTAAE